jgi:hypothetical protein
VASEQRSSAHGKGDRERGEERSMGERVHHVVFSI